MNYSVNFGDTLKNVNTFNKMKKYFWKNNDKTLRSYSFSFYLLILELIVERIFCTAIKKIALLIDRGYLKPVYLS